jgi:photosystem II stability/assembly factor-like uncharacterized protein
MRKFIIAGAIIAIAVITIFWFTGGSSPDDRSDNVSVSVSGFDHAHGVALDTVDSQKLYIATHDGLYLLQNDSDLFRIGSSRDDFMGFSAHPTEPGTFYSSGHSSRGGNIGFQKSVDGGITWERVSMGIGGPVDFHALAASSANPDSVYGFYGGRLQRSIDGGETWEYAKGTVAPISLATNPLREGVVYAATQRGVQVSEDRGDSWKSLSTQLESGAVSVIAYSPHDAEIALAFAEAVGGLGRSTDGGLTWSKVNENFGNDTVLYVAYSRSQQGLVYSLTHSNGIYKSIDDGATWQKVR